MADTKISGLAGAAAFTPSTVQEFPINDAGTSHKVSAAQVAAYFPNGTQGSAWYAQVTANQTGITTQVDVTGLTVTITVGTGRRLLITSFVNVTGTVANNQVIIVLMEGASQLSAADTDVPNTGRAYALAATAVITPTPGAHTYKLQMLLGSGTGSVGLSAGATAPAYILVQDIGT